MVKGKVKWFNDQKGFGFISQSEDRSEIFVHASGLIDEIRENDQVTITPSAFPWSPDTFRSRCARALDFLPASRIVATSEFLKAAIGASLSYLRVLPRWMKAAQAADKPVHRGQRHRGIGENLTPGTKRLIGGDEG